MRKTISFFVLILALFLGSSVFAEEINFNRENLYNVGYKKEIKNNIIDNIIGYKINTILGNKIYFWLNEGNNTGVLHYDGIEFIGIPIKSDSLIPFLLDTGEVMFSLLNNNNKLILILNGQIIYIGTEEEIENMAEIVGDTHIININGKKYTIISEIQENYIENIRIDDLKNLKLNAIKTLDINNIEDYTNTKSISNQTLNQKTKPQYIKQKLLTSSELKKKKQDKYIKQIDLVVEKADKKKLEEIFNKIQKLKTDNQIIKYMESSIYLQLNKTN